jgi:hypothetical protein
MLRKVRIVGGFGFINAEIKHLKIISSVTPVRIQAIGAGNDSEILQTDFRAPMATEFEQRVKRVEFYAKDDQVIEIWAGLLPLEYMQLTAVGGIGLRAGRSLLSGGSELVVAGNMRSKVRLKPEKDILIGGFGVGADGFPVLAGQEIDLESVSDIYAFSPLAIIQPGNKGITEHGITGLAPENETGIFADSQGYWYKSGQGLRHFDGVDEFVTTTGSRASLTKWRDKVLLIEKGSGSNETRLYELTNRQKVHLKTFSDGNLSSGNVIPDIINDLLLVDDGNMELINLENLTMIGKTTKAAQSVGAGALKFISESEVIAVNNGTGENRIFNIENFAAWQLVFSATFASYVARSSGELYCVKHTGTDAARPHRSTDGGRTWTRLAELSVTNLKSFGNVVIYVGGRNLYAVNQNSEFVLVATLNSTNHPWNFIGIDKVALFDNELYVNSGTEKISTAIELDLSGTVETFGVNFLEFVI